MSSSQVLKHITSNTERWDLLAWQYYGDPTLFGPIVMANPSIPIEPVFEAGLVIIIPVIERPATSSTYLPPWKRPQS